jgi:putative ABC transport system ATP-binding protein
MGPSGSGKSTLLNLIAGIDRPDTGTITVADNDVTKLSESQLADWRSHHIGFIFQFYNLIPVLTAYENVELPLLLTKLSKKERDEHVKIALSVVGLSDRMKHYPKQLSGGQQQRVAIARALVNDPFVLIADEPTGNLDDRARRSVFQLLRDINASGTAVLMATHDLELVRRTDYRTIEMDHGRIVYDSGDAALRAGARIGELT